MSQEKIGLEYISDSEPGKRPELETAAKRPSLLSRMREYVHNKSAQVLGSVAIIGASFLFPYRALNASPSPQESEPYFKRPAVGEKMEVVGRVIIGDRDKNQDLDVILETYVPAEPVDPENRGADAKDVSDPEKKLMRGPLVSLHEDYRQGINNLVVKYTREMLNDKKYLVKAFGTVLDDVDNRDGFYRDVDYTLDLEVVALYDEAGNLVDTISTNTDMKSFPDYNDMFNEWRYLFHSHFHHNPFWFGFGSAQNWFWDDYDHDGMPNGLDPYPFHYDPYPWGWGPGFGGFDGWGWHNPYAGYWQHQWHHWHNWPGRDHDGWNDRNDRDDLELRHGLPRIIIKKGEMEQPRIRLEDAVVKRYKADLDAIVGRASKNKGSGSDRGAVWEKTLRDWSNRRDWDIRTDNADRERSNSNDSAVTRGKEHDDSGAGVSRYTPPPPPPPPPSTPQTPPPDKNDVVTKDDGHGRTASARLRYPSLSEWLNSSSFKEYRSREERGISTDSAVTRRFEYSGSSALRNNDDSSSNRISRGSRYSVQERPRFNPSPPTSRSFSPAGHGSNGSNSSNGGSSHSSGSGSVRHKDRG